MNIGMLWFDNDKERDLEAKISRAAEYYRRKYGRQPDVCFVHPSLIKEPVAKAGVDVRPSKTVMPGHLWIGVREK